MTADVMSFVPTLRDDFVRADLGNECVVWSPSSAEPAMLDPLATVMLGVVDGQATMAQLAVEVHEEVGVPLDTAERRVRETVDAYRRAGLLASSTTLARTVDPVEGRELFIAPSTPCSENASRLGTDTLFLNFGRHTIRIACDARRGSRLLREALAAHVVDANDDAPLAFVLTAPQGFRRTHRLVERGGFVLSEGRGLDSGLYALASHLTAFTEPQARTVRIRARAIVTGGRMVVCLDPLLYFPAIPDRVLARAGLALVDRLALDIDVRTGRVMNPEIPWPALAALEAASPHAGTSTVAGGMPVTTVCTIAPERPATLVARIAANGLHGSASDLVHAAAAIVRNAELRTAPSESDAMVEMLRDLRAAP